jgi:anti-sigma28 factor (negative regulator of flagellin synthesis)
MKITDQGFSERITTQTGRTNEAGGVTSGSSSNASSRSGASDTLQLSSLAARLQTGTSVDTDRAARINQIAKAVSGKTFQINPMQIGKAMVSEAIHAAR